MNMSERPLVLLVDDSRTMRMMLRQVLEEGGYEVAEADCAEKAIEFVQQSPPSIIIMDVEMPGMGGVQGVTRIRNLPLTKHVPILMVTAFDDLDSITKSFNAGATQFIGKPVNPNIIGHHIRYMLRSNQVEGELRELSAQLEERVNQRTKELQDANSTLKETLAQLQTTQSQLIEAEKMVALARIVARVAHEVNTPIGIAMTAITSLAEKMSVIKKSYLESQITRTEFVDFVKFAEEITSLTETNLSRAAELIKSFKQVSADQTSEERRVFSLKDYLDKIVASLQPALKQTKLNLTIDCPETISLDSYPGIFFQIITNMVMNSIMHGFDANMPGNLAITASQHDDTVTIQYKDDGKGIQPKDLPRIFEPFYTTKRGAGGVGLGLHIVYNRIVQTLGGTIKCESTPGQGVLFTIQFPRVSKEAPTAEN